MMSQVYLNVKVISAYQRKNCSFVSEYLDHHVIIHPKVISNTFWNETDLYGDSARQGTSAYTTSPLHTNASRENRAIKSLNQNWCNLYVCK